MSSPNKPKRSSQMLVVEISLLQEEVWSSQQCVSNVHSTRAQGVFIRTGGVSVSAFILPELTWLEPVEWDVQMRWDLNSVARLAEQCFFIYFAILILAKPLSQRVISISS